MNREAPQPGAWVNIAEVMERADALVRERLAASAWVSLRAAPVEFDTRALRAEARAAVERFRYRGSSAQAWDEWQAETEDAERVAFSAYIGRMLYESFRMRLEPVEHDLIEGAGTGEPLGIISALEAWAGRPHADGG